MNTIEELESWHEDLMAWERFQDELERIKGEEESENVQVSQREELSLQPETSTQSGAE